MPDAQSCRLQKIGGEAGAAARMADTDKKVLLVVNAGQLETLLSVLPNAVGLYLFTQGWGNPDARVALVTENWRCH